MGSGHAPRRITKLSTFVSKRRRSRLLHSACSVVFDRLEDRRLFATSSINAGGVSQATDAGHIGDPVQISNGLLTLNTTDLQADGFGASWGVSRSWGNTNAYNHSNDYVGTGWDINQNPQLVQPNGSSGTIEIIKSASSALWFQSSGGSYLPWFNNQQSFTYDGTSDVYTLTDLQGDQTAFYGFGGSYTAYAGTFKSYQPASGSLISVTAHVSSGVNAGAIQQEQRQETYGGVTITETWNYNYSGGYLANVALQRQTGSGALTTIRQEAYTYFGSGESFGQAGDLKTASEEDGSGNVLSEDYYRYDTSTNNLTLEFTGPDFARLVQNQGSSGALTASNTVAAPFATLNLSYGSTVSVSNTIPQASYAGPAVTFQPVTGEVVAGMGGGTSGLGTYSFNYSSAGLNSSSIALFSPAASSSSQYDLSVNQTIETLPDGLTDVYYTNYAGQVVLTDEQSSTGHRYTYNQYNGNGMLASTAEPLAVASYSYNTTIGALSVTLNSDSGLITNYTYGSSTTATSTSAGMVLNYLSQTSVQQGTGGSPIEVSSIDYKAQNVSGVSIYYIADSTVYRYATTNSSGGETTSYLNNYASGTFHLQSTVTTLPTISAAQNGPGTSTSDTQVFDADGNVVWERDPRGYVSYSAYDIATGAVVETIDDVTSADAPSSPPVTMPSWTLSSDSLNLTTTYQVDDQGRTTRVTSPNGNVTDTTYDDINHITRVYPGWHYDSSISKYTTTGPIQVMHDDWSLGYTESLTYAYTPVTGVTTPDGSDTISNLQTLSRDITNTSGQVTEEDNYSNLSGINYSTGSIGTINTNYYATLYAYDTGGRQNRVQSPAGTITRTVYDDLGEPIQTWIGAVISGTADDASWPAAGNMILVSAYAYDADGNKIESVQYPGNGSSGRATVDYYDFRDRLIAIMTGGVESAGSIGSPVSDSTTGATDTFVTYYSLDNLGETILTQTYDAKGQAVTFDGSVFDAPSATAAWRFIGSAGVTDGTASIGAGDPAPPDGSQAAFIQGQGAISQTINFNAGSYTLSFYATQRAYYTSGDETLKVLVDGVAYDTVTPSRGSSYDADTTSTFNVSAGTHTITIEGIDPLNINEVALVDDLSITNTGGSGGTPTLSDPSFESVYVGGGYSFSITPPPPNMKLLSSVFNSYDDQGQISFTETLAVDPTTGSAWTSSGGQYTTSDNYYYDANGNLIADINTTGAATKYTYNGAGWQTGAYTTDGGQINNFSNVGIGSSTAYGAAAALTGDIVVAESLDNYDNDGNVIETIQKDRISTDANTSTGALNSAGSAPYARVSYAASYYDAADRDVADVNVGTNGGSSWSGPTTLANVPSGSLVTSYIYDTAGRLSFETDPRGLITAYGYDALGETTITVANWTPSTFMGPVLLTSLGSPTNSSNQTTEYTYDGDGHVVELPPGTTGTFLYQGKKQELRPGSQTINSLVPF